MSGFSFLYVPIDTIENAEKIANELIKQKLAVCVNIIKGATSLYFWNESVETSNEQIMLIKVSESTLEDAKNFIEKSHTYKTPCIAEMAITSLNTEYKSWAESVLK